MSRAGRIRDNTPYCVECGRFKVKNDGPWLQHPTDYGWWCGCGATDDSTEEATHDLSPEMLIALAKAAEFMARESYSDGEGRCSAYLYRAAHEAREAARRIEAEEAAVVTPAATGKVHGPELRYGGCGVLGCTDCLPLFIEQPKAV